MFYLTWLREAVHSNVYSDMFTGALGYLVDVVKTLHRRAVTLGWICVDSTKSLSVWRMSADTRKHQEAYHVVLDVTANHLRLSGFLSDVWAHGAQSLSCLPAEAFGSVVMR